ncbi:MAG: hypothetical protein F4029_02100 [Gammaproteobacteria bacterium]|nr:hypothetical protein [Gammaproteobacteria bacterium]MYK45001.1 hypothetical protein [Gammaproteobacteria bacterium]
MVQTAGSDPTGDAVDAVVAAWRDDPGDRRALAGVRAALLAAHASAVQSGVEGIGELVRAASNLIDRVGEGSVEPNAAVVAAFADAVGRIRNPSRTVDEGAVDVVLERLDAAASGLSDLEFGDDRPAREPVSGQPPLLTVRHDGVPVRPGSFEADAQDSGPPPSELPILVDALTAVGDHLRAQLESVHSLANANANPELRRLRIALQGSVETIERLNRILAIYANSVGG